MTFEQSARAHIASRGSEETRAHYTRHLESWLKLCREHEHDPDAPTLAAAVAFREALWTLIKPARGRDEPSPASIRLALSAISSMYDAAGIANPFKPSRLQWPSPDDVRVTQLYTREEINKIFAAVDEEERKFGAIGLRDRAILRFIYETGARVSTACEMERGALREREGQLILLTKVKKRGRVEVAIPEAAAAVLEAWLGVAPPSRWVFPALRGGGHLAKRAVNQRLAYYGKIAGVPGAAPHRFRATYITEALDAGIPLHEVQASVHHSSPATTLHYDRSVRGAGVASALAKFRQGRK